jgi:toxin FitB
LNVIDSSAWIEYFTDSPYAGYFSNAIEDEKRLIVPSICIYEVFRKLLQEIDESYALQAVTQMQTGRVINLDEFLAIEAARLGHDYKLPLADSIILATTYRHQATLYTLDEHFDGKECVKYFSKSKK